MRTKMEVLGEFVGHLVVGAAMFVALLFTGAGLSMLVRFVSDWLHDPFFGQAMHLAERVLLVADVLFMLWWTAFSTVRAVKELSNGD